MDTGTKRKEQLDISWWQNDLLIKDRRAPRLTVMHKIILKKIITFCHPHPHQDSYNPVHGPLSLVVCIVGILFNLLNILVKTCPQNYPIKQEQDIVKFAISSTSF